MLVGNKSELNSAEIVYSPQFPELSDSRSLQSSFFLQETESTVAIIPDKLILGNKVSHSAILLHVLE